MGLRPSRIAKAVLRVELKLLTYEVSVISNYTIQPKATTENRTQNTSVPRKYDSIYTIVANIGKARIELATAGSQNRNATATPLPVWSNKRDI